MNQFLKVYKILMKEYGPQGWWPLLEHKGSNPTASGRITGYHPGDYSLPKDDHQIFEICVGAILTQNTAWPNVERALLNLRRLGALNPERILSLEEDKLRSAIRPAGYFNQKAKKLRTFSKFFLTLKGRIPLREELLSVWGVGRETADSILLYAYRQPIFVVDAYTRRVFSRLNLIMHDWDYDKIRKEFERNLPRNFETYQEFHALIVEHAKRFCKKTPECSGCPLRSLVKDESI